MNITVSHNEKKKEYQIHAGLLVWHSAWFAAALDPANTAFKEGQVKRIEIEASLDVFDAFCCWLYTGRLRDAPDFEATMHAIDNQTTQEALAEMMFLPSFLLIEIWTFADMRGVPAMCNAAIDMLHERKFTIWKTEGSIIIPIYENSVPGSRLRAFCIDLFTLPESFDSLMALDNDVLTFEFLRDVMPVFLKRAGGYGEEIERKEWLGLNRCRWHDHSGPGGALRTKVRE